MTTLRSTKNLFNTIKNGNLAACCRRHGRIEAQKRFQTTHMRFQSTQKALAELSDKEEQISYLRRSKELLEHDLHKPRFVDLSVSKGITVQHTKKENAHSMLLRHCLEEQPNAEGFVKAVDIYINKNKRRHGHMEFITTAMKFIEPYSLQKDVDVYNKLIDVFPRDKFDNRTLFDAVWPKPHPQINLALDILTKMEWQGITPTEETHDLIYNIFGRASFPLQKIYRMWFWFETFKDINPYSLPDDVYLDRLDVVKAGIDRILGNNDGTEVIELSPSYEDEESERTNYEHFIVSSQSTFQKTCIARLDCSKPLYVEGPMFIWMNHVWEEYFVLKTGRKDLVSSEDLTIQEDEEREGVVLAVCFATRPFKENLQKWVSSLQHANPNLNDVNIVFNITDETAPDYSRPSIAPT